MSIQFINVGGEKKLIVKWIPHLFNVMQRAFKFIPLLIINHPRLEDFHVMLKSKYERCFYGWC